MATWNHLICDGDWLDREPNRIPVRIKDQPPMPCCYCSTMTTSGIWVREDPDCALLECDGVHEDECE